MKLFAVKSCGNPPNVPNGKFEGSTFVEGSQVNFYCNKGYMMTGDAFLVCRNGRWAGTLPTCSKYACVQRATSPNERALPYDNYSQNNGVMSQY